MEVDLPARRLRPTWRRMRRFCWLSAIWCCTRSRGVAGREVAPRGVDAHERGEDARLSGLGASDSASSLILYLQYIWWISQYQ